MCKVCKMLLCTMPIDDCRYESVCVRHCGCVPMHVFCTMSKCFIFLPQGPIATFCLMMHFAGIL